MLVNQSYASQRVTGQQRYATEIARRLLAVEGFEPVGPQGFWASSGVRVWLWVLAVLPLTARSAVLLSMTARAPLFHRRQVLVVHDLFVLTNPEWFSRLYYWTHAPLLRLQLRTAAALVAVSQPVADELARYGARVVVAPNAPSEVFRSSTSEADDDSALTSRGLVSGGYFLTVGSLDPRKNLPALARAYRGLESQERQAHPLVVVGGGSAVFRGQDLDWPEEVVDAGYVSDEELRQLYRGSVAVVFVS
ncbi:MAG: putative glycosyl transferase, partial [Friedmanniella sp.]|nr:putative glycosyl transferase [Friedmanniella sp.]